MRTGFAAAVAMMIVSAAPGSALARGEGAAQGSQTAQEPHYVTVQFNYNFWRTPACSETVKAACVEEFVAYDVTDGVKSPKELFEIKLPAKPVGIVQGITGKSPMKIAFPSNKRLISVVAREPDGTESKYEACTTSIVIP